MKIEIDRPLLTIAIPTFNRLDCLSLLINTLMSQVATDSNFGHKIEILIVNNGSKDGTTEYLKGLNVDDGLRIVNHIHNIGLGRNILFSFEAARGRYVWIMGDDDLPLDGAIKSLIDYIEKQNPDLIYLPAEWIAGEIVGYTNRRVQSLDIMQVDMMTLATTSSVYVTFISSWIMNKDKYLNQFNAKVDRYKNTLLPQLEWIFSLMTKGGDFAYTIDNWVLARAGSSGGYSVFHTFAHEYNQIVDERLSDCPNIHRFFRSNILWCFIPGLVWGVRRNSIGSFGDFDKKKTLSVLKDAYGNDLFFLIIVIPMISLVKPFAWLFWVLARLMAKIRFYWWRNVTRKIR